MKIRVLLVGVIFFAGFSLVGAEDQQPNLPRGRFDVIGLSFEGPHWGGRLPMVVDDNGKKLTIKPKGFIEFKSAGKNKGSFKLEFESERLVDDVLGTRQEDSPASAALEGSYELKDGNVLVFRDKQNIKTKLVFTCHAGFGSGAFDLMLMCDGVFIGRPPWFIGKDSSYYNGYLYSITFQQPYKE